MTTEESWRKLTDSLRAFIARRVGNKHDVDDILQEVLLRIHQNANTLKKPSALVPWCFQIASNCVADYYRHRRSTQPLDNEMPVPVEEDNFNVELSGCLRSMIEELPEPYRTAINVVELGRVTQREYAELTGLSVSGAKTRVQRARKLLRSKLLNCCSVEMDRLGNVVDYRHKDDSERYCKK